MGKNEVEPAKEAEKKHLMGLKEIQENVRSGKSREKSASERKERSPMPNPTENWVEYKVLFKDYGNLTLESEKITASSAMQKLANM